MVKNKKKPLDYKRISRFNYNYYLNDNKVVNYKKNINYNYF